MTDDLLAFLRARIEEDEALATSGESWTAFEESVHGTRRVDVDFSIERVVACTRAWRAEHIARHDPARVIAEVAAKRELIKRGDTLFCGCDESDPPMDPDTNWTVPIPHHYDCTAYRIAQVLATAYQDHPDYDPEWLPFEWAPGS